MHGSKQYEISLAQIKQQKMMESRKKGKNKQNVKEKKERKRISRNDEKTLPAGCLMR